MFPPNILFLYRYPSFARLSVCLSVCPSVCAIILVNGNRKHCNGYKLLIIKLLAICICVHRVLYFNRLNNRFAAIDLMRRRTVNGCRLLCLLRYDNIKCTDHKWNVNARILNFISYDVITYYNPDCAGAPIEIFMDMWGRTLRYQIFAFVSCAFFSAKLFISSFYPGLR